MLADCDVACEKHHVWSNCAKAHNYTKSSCSLKDGSLSAWRKFKPTAILKIYHNTLLHTAPCIGFSIHGAVAMIVRNLFLHYLSDESSIVCDHSYDIYSL